MRIEILALAALLTLGCAHEPAPAPAPVAHNPDHDHYVPGDERVPVRAPADVVGHYRSVLNNEELTIYVDSGELMMRSGHRGQPHRMSIASDGGVGVDASLRGGLIRRHGRVMLHILWCYRWGLYRLEQREAETAPT
jgi:hypothetical protein